MSANTGGAAMTCSKCGVSFQPREWQAASRDYRCPPCKREQQNAKNAADPDGMRERARARYAANKDYWRQYASTRRNDPAYKAKRAARRKVSTEIEAGRLTRQPCEACGNQRADAHHSDYSRPLDVSWFCRSCHIKHDKGISNAAA